MPDDPQSLLAMLLQAPVGQQGVTPGTPSDIGTTWSGPPSSWPNPLGGGFNGPPSSWDRSMLDPSGWSFGPPSGPNQPGSLPAQSSAPNLDPGLQGLMASLTPEFDPNFAPTVPRVPTYILRSQYPGIRYGFQDPDLYGQVWPQNPATPPGDAIVQPTAAATGTPPASFAPPRSTGDLANWRQRYGPNPIFNNIPWDRIQTWNMNTLENLNRMPWVFTPGAFGHGATTADMRNAIFPGAGMGENSLLKGQGQSTSQILNTLQSSGLLNSLTADQRSALETLLGVGGTQANPSDAAGASAPAASSVTAAAPIGQQPTAPTRALRSGPALPAPALEPWQQALVSNNDAFFGLPTNTLSGWKMLGLGHNLGVDPSTYWFFQGLSPDAKAAFMQHQSQIHADAPGGLQSILATWQQPPSNISNPLGVPYPWDSSGGSFSGGLMGTLR